MAGSAVQHAVSKHGAPASHRQDRANAAAAASSQRSIAARFDDDDNASLAQQALRQLGFKPAIAAGAVDAALARVPADVKLVDLIREALRHCR